MVKGERGQRVGSSGENLEADAVARPLGNKGLDDRFDGLQAVDAFTVALIVLGKHRTGKIDREHQVVALLFDFAFVFDDLRSCEGDDEQNQAGHGERGGPA